jgi:hypothetical protein
MNFKKWIYTLVEEKGLLAHDFTVTSNGMTHFIGNGFG